MLRKGDGAVRFANGDSLEDYAVGAECEVTSVDPDEAFEEALFLGLRRNVGVRLGELEREFGSARVEDLDAPLRELVQGGLMCREGDTVRLSGRGRLISNEVFGELLRVAV
jgi:oxygen-independent coproporphyrinogen-3 oxidase